MGSCVLQPPSLMWTSCLDGDHHYPVAVVFPSIFRPATQFYHRHETSPQAEPPGFESAENIYREAGRCHQAQAIQES